MARIALFLPVVVVAGVFFTSRGAAQEPQAGLPPGLEDRSDSTAPAGRAYLGVGVSRHKLALRIMEVVVGSPADLEDPQIHFSAALTTFGHSDLKLQLHTVLQPDAGRAARGKGNGPLRASGDPLDPFARQFSESFRLSIRAHAADLAILAAGQQERTGRVRTRA